MPRTDRGLGPSRPISYTASEIMARRIVDRLCQKPPYGCLEGIRGPGDRPQPQRIRQGAHQHAADTFSEERPTSVIAALAWA
jgi:hypothetical protein